MIIIINIIIFVLEDDGRRGAAAGGASCSIATQENCIRVPVGLVDMDTLCYAVVVSDRKSGFRAGSSRENTKIGPPAGLPPAGGPILRFS